MLLWTDRERFLSDYLESILQSLMIKQLILQS